MGGWLTEQKATTPLQRAFLRRSHAEHQRTRCPSLLLPTSKPGNKGWRGLVVSLSAWGLMCGREQFGPPQGMKANRSFEKLGACLSQVCSRPHTPQGWPSLFVCLALHHPQGSSLLFSHTVCLTSGRCNVTPWGWGNNEGVIPLELEWLPIAKMSS